MKQHFQLIHLVWDSTTSIDPTFLNPKRQKQGQINASCNSSKKNLC